MIVPSMNLEEIKKEIEKDHTILFRKSCYVAHDLERQHHLKSGEIKYLSFDYYSKYKNTWVYSFRLVKKDTTTSFIVYYYAQRGLCAFLKLNQPQHYVFLSAHFFKRYNERLKLNIISPKDIIHSFIRNAHDFAFHKIQRVDENRHKFFCVFQTGVGLGTMDVQTKIYKMNTFLSKDMLKGDQQELEADLKSVLEKYVKTSSNLE